MFNLNDVIIDCNGNGQAQIINGQIEFIANSAEDSVNIRFKPSYRFTDNLLIDIKTDVKQALFDIKTFSNTGTYLMSQIPILDEPTEIDIQGSNAWAGKDLIILKFSAYTPGKYTIGNFRYGRYDSGETNKLTYEPNLIPNGDFEFGLLGFSLWNTIGKFAPKSGKDSNGSYFRFEHVSSENGRAGAYIFSGDIILKKGNYNFETMFKSDQPGRYRWTLTDPDKALSGQYWLDMSNSTGQWQESRAQFSVSKDTKTQVYFVVDSPTSFNLAHMVISPAQNVIIQGNQFILNGTPEHVVGVFHGSPQDCVRAGFKYHKSTSIPTQEDVAFYQASDVKLFADISGLTRAQKLDGLDEIFKIYNQPNVVGWYSDEPNHVEQFTSPAKCRKITELLKYTGLPHFGVVMTWMTQSSDAFQYQDSFDILSTDLYAKDNGKDLKWLAQKIQDFLRTKAGKPRWVVVEANPKLSQGEQRTQAWLPMACGADGTWFWVLDKDTRYDVLKPVVDELNQYKYITGIGVLQDSNVPCSMRFGRDKYIVGVNNNPVVNKVIINNKSQVIPILNASDVKYGDVISLTAQPYEPFVLKVK